MLLDQFLHEGALRAPESVALIEPARSVSYAELDRLANRFANLFLNEGARRGDRIALALETGIDLAAAYFGAMRAGAIAVPLPPGPRSDRLMSAVADCAPVVCVISDRMASEPLPVPCLHLRDLGQRLAAFADERPKVAVTERDLAAIIYTSGSTGAPRGVALSHCNIVANTQSIVAYLGLTARDRVMCVLPFYYVYGLSLLHTHLAVGGSVALDHRFMFPNVVLEAMQRHAVTGFAGVPSTFALLLHRSNLGGMTFPNLRYVTQAGGAMPPAHVLEWLDRGPQVPFYVMYGATEASARLTYLPPSELRRKLGSIGRPIPNVEIAVVTEAGGTARTGEVGELVARGPNIACGYWNNPAETRHRFGPMGYRTGDLGYADEEGFLFLVGRRHDMIKVGGHRVGAGEIEDVLHAHPDVQEAAVLGAPDEILGEAPVAFVVTREARACDADAILTFCRARLPPHKMPVRIIFRPELPKLPDVGKIDKRALRDEAAQQRVS